MKATLLHNANQHYEVLFKIHRDEQARSIEVARALAEEFLNQHGALIADLPVMTKPDDVIRGQAVMARNIRLKTRLDVPLVSQPVVEGIETVFSMRGGRFTDIDPFQWQIAIDDFYEELSYEIDRLDRGGYIMCPYILLMCDNVSLDPVTFEPYLPFTTRYGVISKA